MESSFIRKTSGAESFFIDLEECNCNMTFHYYLKLDRQPDLSELNATFAKVLATHSGINLRYRNDAWYKSDFIPECIVKDIDCEDIYSYKPTRLNHRKQTIGLNLLHMTVTDTWYLCFDFFHGAVDGRSGVFFIYEFFSVLNGNEPSNCEFKLRDKDIIETKIRGKHRTNNYNFTVIPECDPDNWQPSKSGEVKTYVWSHNVCASSLSSKLSLAVGKCFNKSAKMIIPIDIRRYSEDQEKVLFGNLFVPVFIDANTLRKADEIKDDIVNYVRHQPLLQAITKHLSIYTKFPSKIRRAVIRFFLPMVMSSKKFIYCALVSPIGHIDSEKLKNDKFNVEDVNVTFISFPFTAFSVISVQYDGHTNTTVAWDSGRVPQNTANKLIENIDCCLVE